MNEDKGTFGGDLNQTSGRTNILAGVPICIVEDDRATAKVYSRWLERAESIPILCTSLAEFRELLEGPNGWASSPGKSPRLLVVDLVLPDGNGLEVLALWRKHFPQNPVIMVTAFASVENAVEAMRKGAFDFLRKPVQEEELLIVITRGLEHVRILVENENLSSAVRVLSMAQTLSGIHDKEQLLRTLGRLLHREFDAAECFVYLYNAGRKHIECCLDFRNPGLPRRAPETVAQLILADLLAERPPPPESFSTFDLKDLPPPNFTSDPEHQSEVIELSSSTGNSAFLVLLTASASDIENKKSLFFPVLVQAQRTFQNLDLAAALSYVDELTGLYNRRFLDVALSNEIARAHRYRAPIAVLFIDLDKFKEVNDTFGHIVGSAILQAASQLFRQCMRDADQLLRYGGDEFVAILPSTNTQGAAVVAERIRASFCDVTFDVSEETGISEAVSISVTTSIGVACYPEVSTDARELVQMADNAMYESKRAGKNKVTVSQPGSQQGQQSHRDGNLRKLPESG